MSSHNTISLAASRQHTIKHTRSREELTIASRATEISMPELPPASKEQQDKVTLSISAEQTIQVTLLSKLFGKTITLPDLHDIKPPEQKDQSDLQAVDLSDIEGLEFVQIKDHYYEYEQTDFAAEGSITLSDGAVTNFNYQMRYQREFESYSEVTVTQQELKDPLVINFSSQPVSLLSDTFEFDLDSDGDEETLSKLSAGAAFIALDKNNNSTIDNGTELFGAQTGDGFAELAQYDEDQNGVINKHDAIFEQLLVWHPNNQDELTKLNSTDVDTLVLQTVATPYRFTDSNNQTLGQMRQSSVYATSSGSVGGLHQIDLAV